MRPDFSISYSLLTCWNVRKMSRIDFWILAGKNCFLTFTICNEKISKSFNWKFIRYHYSVLYQPEGKKPYDPG